VRSSFDKALVELLVLLGNVVLEGDEVRGVVAVEDCEVVVGEVVVEIVVEAAAEEFIGEPNDGEFEG